MKEITGGGGEKRSRGELRGEEERRVRGEQEERSGGE